MYPLFEALESRTLLSTVSPVAAFKTDTTIMKHDLNAIASVGKANFKLIEADLKSGNELKLKSAQGLLKTLDVEGKSVSSTLTTGVNKTISLITADVNALQADAKAFDKKPSSKLQAKVLAADTKLTTDAANRLTIITNDLAAQRTTNGTNLTAILNAFPTNTTLASNVSTTIDPNAANARTALSSTSTTALTTDITNIITALVTA
jgi:hypothetical protein